MIDKYDFFRTKYGEELLIDLIRLESLEKYIFNSSPHTLSYYDITLITNGKGNFSIDQYKYEITPGSVFFSSPGQIRHWDIGTMPEGYVLIFEDEFLSYFFNDKEFISKLKYFHNLSSPPELSLGETDYQSLINLFLEIEKEMGMFGKNDQHILRAILYQALVWLNRKYLFFYPTHDEESYNRHIHSFTKLVDTNFSSHHQVSFYADKLNITQGHLNDLCKSHLGVNAKEYIQNKIMIEAKKLLSFSSLSVSEIAYHLNFEDPSYFGRRFRANSGITPLAFRKQKNP